MGDLVIIILAPMPPMAVMVPVPIRIIIVIVTAIVTAIVLRIGLAITRSEIYAKPAISLGVLRYESD
jgi:hypothetical protein